MSNNSRLDKVERALDGPGRDKVVVVHAKDPERQAKIDQAEATCGPRDRLVIVECTGGYRGAQWAA
jgi:rhodanese-related sulfurtransferase